MAYKIKNKKVKVMKYDENTEYYLVNIRDNTYDPHLIKGWRNAVNLNLVYQTSSGEENVIPMERDWVLKNKLRKSKFI